MIKVSILMPAFNAERFIRDALASIPKTDEIEIIVVNDGSTDNTATIAKEFDVKLIDRKKNKGVSYSRKEALAAAQGEYIMFFDSDDTLNTENFKKVVDMLDGTDIVYYDMINNNGEIYHLDNYYKTKVVGMVKFIRREYANKFDYPALPRYEDVTFNQMLQSLPHTEKFSNLIVVNYNNPRYDSTSAKWLRGEL